MHRPIVHVCILLFTPIFAATASQISSSEDLIQSLLFAKSNEECYELIKTNQTLLTRDLVKILRSKVGQIGSNGQAFCIYQAIQQIAEEEKDKRLLADAFLGIGIAHYQGGDWIPAKENFQKSLAIGEESGDKSLIALCLKYLGNCSSYLGKADESMEYLQKSLVLYEEIGDKTEIGRVLNNIGSNYTEAGNYQLALEYHEKSLAIQTKLGNKVDMGNCLNNIGIIYDSQGNFEQAIHSYQKSLSLYEQMGEKARVANVLNNLGDYRLLGSYDKALEYNLKSLKIAEELGDKALMARALGNAGNAYRWMGNYEKALEYNRQALALAEELGYKRTAMNELKNVATVHYLKRDYEHALAMVEQAIMKSESADPIMHLVALTLAGRIHKALNHFDQAREFFQKAIAEIEDLRNNLIGGEKETAQFFEERTVSPYIEMMDLLIAENRTDEGLNYAERAKARVLLDVLRLGKINVTKSMTAMELEQEENIKKQLIRLNSEIFKEKQNTKPNAGQITDLENRVRQTRMEYEDFRVRLYAAHPELRIKRGEARPATRNELVAMLDSKAAFLEYTIMKEKLYLFVLTESSLTAHLVKINQKDLAQFVERFRQQLAQRDQGFRKLAKELNTLLLGPASQELKNRTKVVIIPDDVLWELPFQALVTQENKFLIEQFAISYAPSLTVLLETNHLLKNSSTDENLLAFGNPALQEKTVNSLKFGYPKQSLVAIPEAEREVKALAKLYGPESKVYVRSDATEERFKTEIGGFGVLHLATHGVLDDQNPMYSHVVLSQANKSSEQDGLLEAWEILSLNFSADLAVLSSCETARGHVGRGEGIIGFSWAFFVAGIPTTLVSQWKVDSASTTQLMLAFHKFRKQNRLETAQALQSAAWELLRTKKYRHPFYWAGFVAVGKAF